VRTVDLPENVGIPQGRYVGADNTKGHHLFLFYNDAYLPDTHTLVRLVAEFHKDSQLAYVQPLITEPDTHITLRRWVPRLRASNPCRAGVVTLMAENVVLVRRDALDAAGGWPGHFFLFHEGVDLAGRLWNLGHTGRYAPDIVVHHPATDPARQDTFYKLNARNRVWLARRNLPRPLIPLNLATWTLLTLWRVRGTAALRTSLTGLREDLRGSEGEHNPISWRTIAGLTRAGRPPVM
jgi:GT2 family glycosyltransferase